MFFPFNRLPIYLLVDCSASMAGERIEAVRQAIRAMLVELRGDPYALEYVSLSVISFARTAQQVCPLTDLANFSEPTLNAAVATEGEPTHLGEALALLRRCLNEEVHRPSSTQRGDYPPLVFLLTGGTPTDSWEALAHEVRRRCGGVAVLMAGASVNAGTYGALTPQFTGVIGGDANTMKLVTRWATQSIRNDDEESDTASVHLAPPPANSGINIVF
jgi:uncharacterized protein YegL